MMRRKLAWCSVSLQTFAVGLALMRNNLLVYKKDPVYGKTMIDWAKTRAYPR